MTRGVCNYIAYNDTTDDFVMGWRNRVWSRQAWHARKAQFVGHQELGAFGEGFRDGYRDVASGGNGCPPPVPPRKYWSWRYQTAEGQCKVAAWYEGFPYGAQAAAEEGAGEHQQIQVSHAIVLQYSPQFLNGELPTASHSWEEIPPGEVPGAAPVDLLPPNALEGPQTNHRPVTAWPDGVVIPASHTVDLAE